MNRLETREPSGKHTLHIVDRLSESTRCAHWLRHDQYPLRPTGLQHMKCSYTVHAWRRVADRISLSPSEVADILDADACVDIGTESGSSRVHRLFYSAPDLQCFVAVQDQANGEVITVLPLDFHSRCAWIVPLSAQQLAKSITQPSLGNNSRLHVAPFPNEEGGPRIFRVIAYRRLDSGVAKVLNLGSWPSQPYKCRIELLLDDESFFESLRAKIGSMNLTVEDLGSVFVTLGRRSKPTRIQL